MVTRSREKFNMIPQLTFHVLLLFSFVSCELQRRIVDGASTTAKPWMVLLAHPNAYCGGTLYTRSLVITAAHCKLFDTERWKAYVNIRFIKPINLSGGTVHNVIMRYNHPSYRFGQHSYDIGVWWIAGTSNERTVVDLDVGVEAFDLRNEVRVLGWGNTARMSPEQRKNNAQKVIKPELQEASIPVVQNALCALKYKMRFNPYNMFCVGRGFSGPGSSMGDSGGPVFRYKNNRVMLVGVISFCEASGYDDSYDVNTRISAFSIPEFIHHYLPYFRPESLKNNRPAVFIPPFKLPVPKGKSSQLSIFQRF